MLSLLVMLLISVQVSRSGGLIDLREWECVAVMRVGHRQTVTSEDRTAEAWRRSVSENDVRSSEEGERSEEDEEYGKG